MLSSRLTNYVLNDFCCGGHWASSLHNHHAEWQISERMSLCVCPLRCFVSLQKASTAGYVTIAASASSVHQCHFSITLACCAPTDTSGRTASQDEKNRCAFTRSYINHAKRNQFLLRRSCRAKFSMRLICVMYNTCVQVWAVLLMVTLMK